jgi:hypothetical protein
MSARHFLSVAVPLLALLVSPLGRAQQMSAPTTPNGSPTASTNAANAKLTTPHSASDDMIADSIKKMGANDPDGALNDLNQALKLNPTSTGALVLRASIYCQKKEWDLAEADFRTAAKIAPTNAVLKFNLIEVKFMQKQYDVARPGFLALEKDPDVLKGDPEMVDFAQYKVFLCDLFGGHLDVAKKELDVFNDAMGNPSYYFANAAWDLVHHNIEGARSWLLSASRIYAPRKNAYYSQSLRDTGYLPIPEPPAAQ